MGDGIPFVEIGSVNGVTCETAHRQGVTGPWERGSTDACILFFRLVYDLGRRWLPD